MEESSIEEIKEECRQWYEQLVDENLNDFESDMILSKSRTIFKENTLPMVLAEINHIINILDKAYLIDSKSDEAGIEYAKILLEFITWENPKINQQINNSKKDILLHSKKETIVLYKIHKNDYPEDWDGYKLIKQNQIRFDADKGFVDYECIIQRNIDNKFFKFTFTHYGVNGSNLLEQIAIEVQEKEKTIKYYE